jgi:hypothetical protein
MEWKGSDKLKVIGKVKDDSSVQSITIDGIDAQDKDALSEKHNGYSTWSKAADPKKTVNQAGAAAASGGRTGGSKK